MLAYNKKLLGSARHLRKNMTDEEKHLWYDFLSKLPVSAKRQKNIGNYIVDFYVPQAKLVIEVDGVQHSEPDHIEADAVRDAELRKLGIEVLRFRNADINSHFTAVTWHILEHLRGKGVDV